MPSLLIPADARGLENQAQVLMLDQYAGDLWTMIHHTGELTHDQALDVLLRLAVAVERDREKR
jgi:hypothetical protein